MSPLNAPICTTTYLKRQKCYGPDKKILFKKQLFDLEVKGQEGHYGMRHTALWSCTHIPNIIDLSGKTKKLWFRKASLRRSRRKNQTKTMSPFVRRGDIIINKRTVRISSGNQIYPSPANCCTCPKPGPRFPSPYVVAYL